MTEYEDYTLVLTPDGFENPDDIACIKEKPEEIVQAMRLAKLERE